MGRVKKRRSFDRARREQGFGAGTGPEVSIRTRQAGHRAAEDDRVWFEQHPQSSVRVREALCGEHDEQLALLGLGPLDPDQRLAVVVVQAAPGRRMRVPYCIVSTEPAHDRLTTQQLDAVRSDWESCDQTVPFSNSRGEVYDALALFRLACSDQSHAADLDRPPFRLR